MNKILYYTKTTKLKHEPVNTTPLGMKLKVIQLEVNTELCRKKWVYFTVKSKLKLEVWLFVARVKW